MMSEHAFADLLTMLAFHCFEGIVDTIPFSSKPSLVGRADVLILLPPNSPLNLQGFPKVPLGFFGGSAEKPSLSRSC